MKRGERAREKGHKELTHFSTSLPFTIFFSLLSVSDYSSVFSSLLFYCKLKQKGKESDEGKKSQGEGRQGEDCLPLPTISIMSVNLHSMKIRRMEC